MSSTSAMVPNVKCHHQQYPTIAGADEPDGVASSLDDASSAGVRTPTSSFGGSPATSPSMLSPPTQTQGVHNSSTNTATAAQRPVLYSAIGSLENYSVNNMGSFRTRILNAQQNGGTNAGGARDFPHSSSNRNGNNDSAAAVGRNFPLLPPSKAAAPTPIMANKHLHSPTTGVPLQLLTTKHHPTAGLVSALAAAEQAQRDSLHHENNNCGLQEEKKSATPSPSKDLEQPRTPHSVDDPESKAAYQTKSNETTQEESTTVRHNSSSSDASVPSIAATEVSPEATLALPSTTSTTTLSSVLKKPSSSKLKKSSKKTSHKHVTIDSQPHHQPQEPPIEMFRPSCDAYTPRLNTRDKMKYKPAELRTPVQTVMRTTTMGTISRPNFRDALRRVAMILQQHIVKIERRFENEIDDDNTTASANVKLHSLFSPEMADSFCEERFVTPRYKVTMVRIPMADPGVIYGMRKIDTIYTIPTADEIYDFAHQLFQAVQLSSECSIVCLIYVERLMEVAKVPLLAKTWRPIFMCGLLLASKVWQDLSSWNIEFASVYPQFSLDAINRLELQFLRMVKWDLYISSSLYAKYYFALRSLLEKKDFRQRYNRMVGVLDSVAASEALKVQQRTEVVKEEALLQLSRSM